MIKRDQLQVLSRRLQEPRRFIQALLGPRQVGKTTLAGQVLEQWQGRGHYVSADEPTLKDAAWLRREWTVARQLCADGSPGLLVVDEVQKAIGWAETVKALWDEDTFAKRPLPVVLLGSSPWLVQRGLSESLAGRFEVIPVTHWSFVEMHDAFGWSLDQYLHFGGYPGGAALIDDQARWRQYILDSLIETTISRDLLLMTRIDKPALLRRLFLLACEYSGQVLSYQKMVGQLQDPANTVTLAHYLDLLTGAGLVTGLQKFAGQRVRQRGSSPKLAVFNTALMSALSGRDFAQSLADREYRGRLTESAILAHALNAARGADFELFYWLDRGREVDLVVRHRQRVVAFEIKSGASQHRTGGLDAFCKAYPATKSVLVGGKNGIPVATFLSRSLGEWFA